MAWAKLGSGTVSGTVANTSWKELARASGTGTSITTDTFAGKDNLMILTDTNSGSSTATGGIRFNANVTSSSSDGGIHFQIAGDPKFRIDTSGNFIMPGITNAPTIITSGGDIKATNSIYTDGTERINNTGDILNIGDVTTNKIYNNASNYLTIESEASGIILNAKSAGGQIDFKTANSTRFQIDSSGNFKTGSGTTVINSSGTIPGSRIVDGSIGSDQIATNAVGTNEISNSAYASICFLEGTKIKLANGEEKNIEDISMGDEILTYYIDGISNQDKHKVLNYRKENLNGYLSSSKIKKTYVFKSDHYIYINETMKVTSNHIIHFRRGGMCYFDYTTNLCIGDELLTSENKYVGVYKKEDFYSYEDQFKVYNIELVKDSTYFADNFLVSHICQLCYLYLETKSIQLGDDSDDNHDIDLNIYESML